MKTIFIYCMAVMMMGVSCKKADNGGTGTLAAETMLDVAYGPDAAQKMDIYLPQGRTTTATKAFIVIHGGAWASGDKTDMTSTITGLKAMLPDYAFFNINYRLATTSGNLWPAQMDDLNTAFNFIVSHSDHYKFNSNKIVTGGASAGAHLALLKGYAYNSGNVKAVVDLFGPADMKDLYNTSNTSSQFALNVFMSGTPSTNPAAYTAASPLFAVNSSSVPTIILHGTADAVVPIHQSDSLNNRLANAGIAKEYYKYPGEIHGVWSAGNTTDAYNKIAAFLNLYVK